MGGRMEEWKIGREEEDRMGGRGEEWMGEET